MKLPRVAVIEYQQLYRDKFGVDLSFEEAKRKATNFLKLMALITTKPRYENGNIKTKPRKNEKLS